MLVEKISHEKDLLACTKKNTLKIAKNRVYILLTSPAQSVTFELYGNVQKYYSIYFIMKRKEEISNGNLC